MKHLTNNMKYSLPLVLLLLAMMSLFQQCRDPQPENKPTPYELTIPKGFPTRLNIPADNPLTVEGIELGRYLFYDGRLSGRTDPDSLMSCGTCHLQQYAFECGIDHPVFTDGHPHGLNGSLTPNVMLSLQNLVWNESGYEWNGFVNSQNQNGFRNIEDIVYQGVVSKHEIAGDTSKTVALIQSINGYPQLFEKAFGSPKVTFKNISRAIAQFVRTLTSTNSKFDRYLRGEEQLSEAELSGYVLFMTENGGDCFHCHGGDGNPLFTTNLFYNNGLDTVFSKTNDRFSITGINSDIGAYKAPTLRNVELTGPYMHDGRFKTLEEVIDFYSEGVKSSPYINPLMHHVNGGGVRLLPKQKQDIIAFIKTLRDDSFLTNPAFSRPAKMPDGK